MIGEIRIIAERDEYYDILSRLVTDFVREHYDINSFEGTENYGFRKRNFQHVFVNSRES